MNNPSESSSCNSPSCGCSQPLTRRDFIRWTGLAVAGATASRMGAIAGPFEGADFEKLIPADKRLDPAWVKLIQERGKPTEYRGGELETIGMPIGGICAGQLYLGGDGRLWHWDIFNLPQPSHFSDTGGPNYAHPPKPESPIEQGFGIRIESDGRAQTRALDSRGFDPKHITFRGQYPVAFVDYRDPELPVTIALEAFSPFIPLNVPDSSLPATVVRFSVKNHSQKAVVVELAGWIENAVCLGSGLGGVARRRNRFSRDRGVSFMECNVEPLPKLDQTPSRPEIVFETFENGYGAWKAEGTAFGSAPAEGTLPGQQAVSGFLGKKLVNTFLDGDSTKGRLTSPGFKIERRFISFLVGGGAMAKRTCINLFVDDRQVRTATGHNSEALAWQEWDVSEFEGRTGRIEIVDDSTEGWGHINVDQIVFTDETAAARVPLEAREDYGSMGIALVGKGSDPFAQTRVSAPFAEGAFADMTSGGREDAVLSAGGKLVGAVGRKLKLAPGAEGDVVFVLAWHFPGLLRRRLGPLKDLATLRRSYASRFKSAAGVARYVARDYKRLAGDTMLWNKTWYESTLPYWFLDRTFAPICTLATSTCYQFTSGRFYAFEGVYCCEGTCQHVWNYAHSVARIFPELERDLRERTDFGTSWHENGAIDYRGECARHVAHDGQCGVILRAWREHQMAPDDRYLRACWPRIRKSISYLIGLDGGEDGLLEGEQYNTLDAAWFGPMAWISSFYVAALRAGEAMARELGDTDFAVQCQRIASRGSQELVKQLYNGEFFIHKPDPQHPKATNTNDGCHIDQLMGQAWAMQVGLPRVIQAAESRSALQAIWKYNFTPDVGPYRKESFIKGGRWYAMAGEGGVVMTTFPRGGIEQAAGQSGFGYYFNEVWTGQEHQLAAHMIWEGMVEPAMIITRILHDRHHASKRNPYNEVECSDHYTRAMSSHGSFIAASGYEHHGPGRHIGFDPRITPERFKSAFTAAEGWGTFQQVREGARQIETLSVRYGRLRIKTLAFGVREGQIPSRVEVKLGSSTLPATFEVTGTRARVILATETTLKTNTELVVTFS